MDLTPSTILKNRYQIIRKLGHGGMGAVYLAADASLSHEVAIKVNFNPSRESTTQFLREARMLAGLRHPNLPRVIDYFVMDENQYFVMDYIPGEDLAARIKSGSAQPLELVLEWAIQLGGALSYLHAQTPPVIHRDIKPANIKITPDGRAILVDFGIAKVSDSSQRTASGALGYTPGFAPPEQYGTERTGDYSDQYALAATLYTSLAGTSPSDSVQRALGEAHLTPLAALNPAIPAHVDRAIQRALSLEPEKRFPGVADFIKAIQDPAYKTVETAQKPLSGGGRRFSGLLFVLLLLVLGGFGVGAYLVLAQQGVLAGLLVESTTVSPPPLVVASTVTPPVMASETPLPSDTPALTATPSPTPVPLGGVGVLAYVSNRGDGEMDQIWLMKLDESGKVIENSQLTASQGSKAQPRWSPDGKQILFVAPGEGGDKKLGQDIWVMNADGSNPVDLSMSNGNDWDPNWSADGKWVAFTSDRVNGYDQVFTMKLDGKDQTNVTMGYALESSPIWSPDMQWMAYTLVYGGGPPHFFLRQVTEKGVSSTPQAFDRRSPNGNLGVVKYPAWSPDGELLAYTRDDNGFLDICTVKFSPTGPQGDFTTLTGAHKEMEPAWSPDGMWLAFTSRRDGNAEVYLMTSGGSMQTNLTANAAEDRQPDWLPVSKSGK